MYTLLPENAYDIVTNSNLKLPRFQRKPAWSNEDRFKLCISLFKGYPMGTIVEREEGEIYWLLDGRQRKDTFTAMQNPVNVYYWAKSFLGFKEHDDDLRIRTLFTEKLCDFLYNDNDQEQNEKSAEELDTESDADSTEILSESSDESVTDDEIVGSTDDLDHGQLESTDKHDLEDLLDIIISVHVTNKGRSEFTKPFDFKDENYRLGYYGNDEDSGKTVVQPELLTRWIISRNVPKVDSLTDEQLVGLFEACPLKHKKEILNRADAIKKSIRCVNTMRDRLKKARLSVITLDDSCSYPDSRKIFEIINKQGVALTNAEILSAKPSWNMIIKNPRDKLLTDSRELYKSLGIDQLNVVNWDVAATFTSRLSEYSDYVFGNLRTTPFEIKGKNTVAKVDYKINYGFKLLSGRYCNAISKLDVENIPQIFNHWNSNEFESEIHAVTKLLKNNDPLIQHLKQYHYSIAQLLGDTVAMDYILVLIKKYNAVNTKGTELRGKARKEFLVDSRILLDRLVYEYATNAWSGASDSRLKTNLENYEESFEEVPEESWNSLIDKAYQENKINNQTAKKNRISALLYYFSLLLNKRLDLNENEVPQVDHIIPDSEFTSNSTHKEFKNSLINFALLSPTLNKRKNNSYSNLDNATKEDIAELEDVSVEILEHIRNPGAFDDLYKERIKIADKIKSKRASFIKAEGEWDLKA